MRFPPAFVQALPLIQLFALPARLRCSSSIIQRGMSAGSVGNGGRVKAITFDLDDTLWATLPPLIRANKMHIEHINANFPSMQLDTDSLKAEMKVVREVIGADAAADLTILRRKTIESLAVKAGYPPEEVSSGAMAVFLRERNNVELFDGVQETLELLRGRGYVLGTITNGNADVEQTPLRGLVDFSIVAGRIGAPKPLPGSFLEACRLAGARPNEVVHVGDDPATDVDGARGAGLRSVWYRPEGSEEAREAVAADAVIQCMKQLPGVVESFGG